MVKLFPKEWAETAAKVLIWRISFYLAETHLISLSKHEKTTAHGTNLAAAVFVQPIG
jgi:hypothetical protein